MMRPIKINRQGWLAIWLQKRRRKRQPKSLLAPSLVSLGMVDANTTWRAVAPMAVDDWQFCTTDNAFNPEVQSFDRWLYEADAPDTAFVVINPTTATVNANFAYCAARYLIGSVWSPWTGVLDATVIPPPAQLVLSSDGHGHLTWTSSISTEIGFSIYRSDDGISWDYFDTQPPNLLYRDCSGQSGYFRIAVIDEDGNPLPPYSNVVYSDGL